MTIDERHLELINADIDGDITDDQARELEELLASDAGARALNEELRSLCDTLDAEGMIEPPSDLTSSIMAALPDRREAPAATPAPEPRRSFFEAPLLRYAASFAAGIVVAILLADSTRVSNSTFDDVTYAVGTISDPSAQSSPIVSESIDELAIAGQVTLRSSGQLLIVDIEVTTAAPVDVVTSYPTPLVWFNGFAQLESRSTQISTTDSEVRVNVDGQRRYALYLNHSGGEDLPIEVRFVVDGEAIHETTLIYPSSG